MGKYPHNILMWRNIMNCPFCIKKCKKCSKLLVANEINFHKHKGCKYNLNSICKKCEKEYKQDYYNENKENINLKNKQYYEENKEEVLKQMKQYYENNKEDRLEYHKEHYNKNKEEILKQQKEYYENNKEKIKEYYKGWYENNKEHILEYQKEYKKNNPQVKINSHNKRRILTENQGNGFTKEQWLEMMEFFNWRCAYSGEVLGENRSVDHIIPLSKGGEHEIWNCVPMLKNYNSQKRTKDMLKWYIQQPFFSEERLLKIFEWINYAYEKWYMKDM